MARAVVPASPWMWAKAAHELVVVIRLCNDGVAPNVARMGVFCIIMEILMHPFCSQNRTVRTHRRTPDAPSWCSRLAVDVGEGRA